MSPLSAATALAAFALRRHFSSRSSRFRPVVYFCACFSLSEKAISRPASFKSRCCCKVISFFFISIFIKMIVWRFRGRASPFLSSRLFAKVTACRGRFANHSPLILQKSFLPTNILIYASEPFIFSTFARFFISERPGSSNRLT